MVEKQHTNTWDPLPTTSHHQFICHFSSWVWGRSNLYFKARNFTHLLPDRLGVYHSAMRQRGEFLCLLHRHHWCPCVPRWRNTTVVFYGKHGGILRSWVPVLGSAKLGTVYIYIYIRNVVFHIIKFWRLQILRPHFGAGDSNELRMRG